ncbi:MAG: outer membrane beta-barrel protein [Cyclobacteriaceae bacterium]|nr:outer membrane beta-barrel protein [Cyclobacteriaceae bacterium]
MKKIVLVGFLAGFLASDVVLAQSFFAMRRDRSLILTVGTGTSSYLGDLANEGDYLQANLNLHAGLQYYLSNRIAIRSEVSWFQLHGDDAKGTIESGRRNRNLNFQSNNFEINGVAMISLYPQGRSFYQRPPFNLYGFAGVGLLYFNPTTEYNGAKYQLQPQQTELVSYSLVTPIIPMGIGMRFKLGPFTNLSIEAGYRKTFTDYLDDVSTIHHDAAKFPNALAAALSDRRPEIGLALKEEGFLRGNPNNNDAYILYSVKVEYYLPINFFQGGGGGQKTFKTKRKAFYRYNKRGGLKK